jgi:hypothetical protein
MRSILTLFFLAASACAYEILSPSNSSGWTTAGPNNVTWTRVSTDQTTFALVLVNQDTTVQPTPEVLIATVDGSLLVITVSPPSAGFQAGSDFRINFVNDSSHLTTILAQSSQFVITQSNTTTSKTAVPTITAATAASNPSQTTDTSGNLNPTDSGTNSTSPSKNGADRITSAGSTGLLFAALAAFFL